MRKSRHTMPTILQYNSRAQYLEVANTNANRHPNTMMIETRHTNIAIGTMSGMGWLIVIAGITPPVRSRYRLGQR
jgi:hypothetical protein